MKLTWSQVVTVGGSSFTRLLPPPFAKTLAVYHTNLSGTATIEAEGGPVGSVWNINVPINSGQPAATMDLPNGTNFIQISNSGLSSDTYMLIWGLAT